MILRASWHGRPKREARSFGQELNTSELTENREAID